jgi:hypothetical protein
MKPEILVLVILKDDLNRFDSKHIASSSIVISSIILLVGSFNVFLIILIIRREYWIKRRQIGF